MIDQLWRLAQGDSMTTTRTHSSTDVLALPAVTGDGA